MKVVKRPMETINELDIVITNLNERGYTLDFNPDRSTSVPWGISAPWPVDLEFEVEDIIDSYCIRQGKEIPLRVFAVKTKKFNLQGILIASAVEEKLWSIDDIFSSFKKMFILFGWIKKNK